MKIQSEEQLLNPEIRAALIKHWDMDPNVCRKAEAFKAYECLKDKTSVYVRDLLLKQFDFDTVVDMQYAISNISILRKVISKLAKVYDYGVKRTMPNKKQTEQVEEAAETLRMNAAMKKANKYFRTFHNTLIHPHPVKTEGLMRIEIDSLPPFKYDVVEMPENPKEAMAIVVSDYIPMRGDVFALGDAAVAGRTVRPVKDVAAESDWLPGMEPRMTGSYTNKGKDSGGADTGKDKRVFTWWTKNYHFVTDAKGNQISVDNDNPIKALPFVNLAGERDDSFWAEGGRDLVDSGISINTAISNVKHLGISQGHGQLYMTGKNLPKSIKVGPTHCVQLAQAEGEPDPKIGYLNANPDLDKLRGLIEMDVALMLVTNNLSTSGFAMSLQGGKDFASGISLMIDKSESIDDVEEQAGVFIEQEPDVWVLVLAWYDVLKSAGLLTEEFRQMVIPKNVEEVQLQFGSPKPMLSEMDELTVIEKRRELNLNTEVEILMRDNPALTEAEARAKLAELKAEKEARVAEAAAAMVTDGNQSEDGNGNPDENGIGNRPRFGSKSPAEDEDEDQE